MDEHRIGLKPILRRVWAPKGATVKAPVAQRYEWIYVFACVHPQSGRTRWLLFPTVNGEVCSRALAVFAQEIGAGPDKQIVLVLDRAGWHRSAQLRLPEGIHLVFLPPIHLKSSLPSDSGRFPMSRWPIESSPLSTSWSRCRLSAVGGSRIIHRSSRLTPAFLGGPLQWTILKRISYELS
jgi:DDE superfamily endonuclease